MSDRRVWRLVRARQGTPRVPERFGDPLLAGPGLDTSDPCARCGALTPAPLPRRGVRLEWPTNVPLELPDLVWPAGGSTPLVRRTLGEELAAAFGGIELGAVDVDERRLRASDLKPGAALPAAFVAEVRQRVQLAPLRIAALDRSRSEVDELRPPCPRCGVVQVRPPDLVPLRSDAEARHGVWRITGSVVVDVEPGLFVLEHAPQLLCCTSEVRERLAGCSNAGFAELGVRV